MKLVEALACGVRGAELGVARIYAFGTSTRINYYADFVGTLSPTTGDDLPLDSDGSSVVYVNQLADVAVYDSAGNLLKTFTAGDASPSVEVISNSFTGVNRTSGASAAGQPTTLQSVLDRWFTSAGAIDWKVLFNGSATNLQTAIASVAGIYFNVKDPAYGARGDGATDDTTPIQNAITAAAAVKGTVVFPAGTYRTTATLNVSPGVGLLGVGATGSIIKVDHATAVGLTMTGAAGTPDLTFREIRGIQVGALQANSGNTVLINGTGPVRVAFVDCLLGGSLSTGVTVNVSNSDSHWLMLDNCRLVNASATNGVVTANQTIPLVYMRNCNLAVSGNAGAFTGSVVTVRNALVTACTFDLSSIGSGTALAMNLDGTAGAGPKVTVTGCDFIPPSAGTSGCFQISNGNESTTSVGESGNIFRTGWTTVFTGFTAQSNLPSILALSRQSLGKNLTDNTASVNVLADQYGYTALTRTTNGNQTLTSSIGPAGSEFTIILFNNSGGASGTITYGAGFANSGATLCAAMANGKLAMQQFRAAYVNGAAAWLPVSAAITGI